MEDENGYDWVDDAVPSGTEIARVLLGVLRSRGWAQTWGDCTGLRICPRVRVWLDGYKDLDFEQAFLLRVWTDHAKDEAHVTVTDHLAVYARVGGKLDVEWRQDPRLFFDEDEDWSVGGDHWFASWLARDRDSLRRYEERSSPTPASIAAHNRRIRERDRQIALNLGLGPSLPYLGTHGRLWTGRVVRRRGRPCDCHRNAAALWFAGRAGGIGTGYALSDDGLWREHSWGLGLAGELIETTEPRTAYFGVELLGRRGCRLRSGAAVALRRSRDERVPRPGQGSHPVGS